MQLPQLYNYLTALQLCISQPAIAISSFHNPPQFHPVACCLYREAGRPVCYLFVIFTYNIKYS